jgi:hypothetical protein
MTLISNGYVLVVIQYRQGGQSGTLTEGTTLISNDHALCQYTANLLVKWGIVTSNSANDRVAVCILFSIAWRLHQDKRLCTTTSGHLQTNLESHLISPLPCGTVSPCTAAQLTPCRSQAMVCTPPLSWICVPVTVEVLWWMLLLPTCLWQLCLASQRTMARASTTYLHPHCWTRM